MQTLKVNIKEKYKNKSDLTKILGVPWYKNRDNLSVVGSGFNEKLKTKRNVLSYIVSIYDPLGLTSVSHITGKVNYSSLYTEGARTKLFIYLLVSIVYYGGQKNKQTKEWKEKKRSGNNLCIFAIYQGVLIFSRLKEWLDN